MPFLLQSLYFTLCTLYLLTLSQAFVKLLDILIFLNTCLQQLGIGAMTRGGDHTVGHFGKMAQDQRYGAF